MFNDAEAIKHMVEAAEEAGADAKGIIRTMLEYIAKVLEQLKELAETIGLNAEQKLRQKYTEAAKKTWEGMYQMYVAKGKEATAGGNRKAAKAEKNDSGG